MSETQWVAIDWGTSNVRAWGLGDSGNICFSVQSEKGMARLSASDYPAVLANLLADDISTSEQMDIVICGMAGAKQGWLEAGYLATPANLHQLGANAVSPALPDCAWNARILSGVCQYDNEDVMRGEETQLLGLMRLQPDFSGIVCMPGTHAKWAELRDGNLIRFATSMTGELFELLSAHSVLQHSLQGDIIGPATEAGVETGLKEGLAAPERVTSLLFRTRAASLLSGKEADWCAGYLSGLLIGAEVAGYKSWLTASAKVPLIGSSRLCRTYGRALALAGFKSETIDAATATIAGLTEARKQIAND